MKHSVCDQVAGCMTAPAARPQRVSRPARQLLYKAANGIWVVQIKISISDPATLFIFHWSMRGLSCVSANECCHRHLFSALFITCQRATGHGSGVFADQWCKTAIAAPRVLRPVITIAMVVSHDVLQATAQNAFGASKGHHCSCFSFQIVSADVMH